jgi:hypothetical protein
MSFRKALPFALTAMLTLTAAGCGGDDSDDTTGPNGDTPTQVEVQNMMVALSTALTAALSGGPTGLAAQTNYPFEFSGSCPNGGTSSVTGNYTLTNQSTFNYTLTQSFTNCAAPGNGTIYTFNGTGLTTTVAYSLSGSTYSYNIHQSGTLGWAGGGKSASCTVNWGLQLGYTNTGYTYQYSGTYCGVSIAG